MTEYKLSNEVRQKFNIIVKSDVVTLEMRYLPEPNIWLVDLLGGERVGKPVRGISMQYYLPILAQYGYPEIIFYNDRETVTGDISRSKLFVLSESDMELGSMVVPKRFTL